jgi:4-alpha-glucanotransferase
MTRPFINDKVIERLFGIHAQYVKDNFLILRGYGLYDLRAEFKTQKKIRDYFE